MYWVNSEFVSANNLTRWKRYVLLCVLCVALASVFFQSSKRFYESDAVQELVLRRLWTKGELDRQISKLEKDFPWVDLAFPPQLTPKVEHLESYIPAIAKARKAWLQKNDSDKPLLEYFNALTAPKEVEEEEEGFTPKECLEKVEEEFAKLSTTLKNTHATLMRHSFLLESDESSKNICRRLDKQSVLLSSLVKNPPGKDWKTVPKSSAYAAELATGVCIQGPNRIKRRRRPAGDWSCEQLFDETYEFCKKKPSDPLPEIDSEAACTSSSCSSNP